MARKLSGIILVLIAAVAAAAAVARKPATPPSLPTGRWEPVDH